MRSFFRNLALLLITLSSIACWARPTTLSPHVQVEIIQSVSTRELWNFAAPKSIEASNVVVESRQFDSESQPRRDRWIGCALVMVGTSDLGIQPVALRIWTDKSCELSISPVAPGDSGTEFEMHMGGQGSIKIVVTNELKVVIGGHVFGKIED